MTGATTQRYFWGAAVAGACGLAMLVVGCAGGSASREGSRAAPVSDTSAASTPAPEATPPPSPQASSSTAGTVVSDVPGKIPTRVPLEPLRRLDLPGQTALMQRGRRHLLVSNAHGAYFTLELRDTELDILPGQPFGFRVDGQMFRVVVQPAKKFTVDAASAGRVLLAHKAWETQQIQERLRAAGQLGAALEVSHTPGHTERGLPLLLWKAEVGKARRGAPESRDSIVLQIYAAVLHRGAVIAIVTYVTSDEDEVDAIRRLRRLVNAVELRRRPLDPETERKRILG